MKTGVFILTEKEIEQLFQSSLKGEIRRLDETEEEFKQRLLSLNSISIERGKQ